MFSVPVKSTHIESRGGDAPSLTFFFLLTPLQVFAELFDPVIQERHNGYDPRVMKHTTDLDASKVGQIVHVGLALPYGQHSVSSILNYLLTCGHYTAELSFLVWGKDCALSSRHEEERVLENDHTAGWAVWGRGHNTRFSCIACPMDVSFQGMQRGLLYLVTLRLGRERQASVLLQGPLFPPIVFIIYINFSYSTDPFWPL